jgi:hypothetical protein
VIQPQNFSWTMILHAPMSLILWNLVWNWICVSRFMLNVLYVLDKFWVLIHFNLKFMKNCVFALFDWYSSVWGLVFLFVGQAHQAQPYMTGLTHKTLNPCLAHCISTREKNYFSSLKECLANTLSALIILFFPLYFWVIDKQTLNNFWKF